MPPRTPRPALIAPGIQIKKDENITKIVTSLVTSNSPITVHEVPMETFPPVVKSVRCQVQPEREIISCRLKLNSRDMSMFTVTCPTRGFSLANYTAADLVS